VLDQLGFSALEGFPVYADRMPNQLLAYLRLARLQDPALFAKVGCGGVEDGLGGGLGAEQGNSLRGVAEWLLAWLLPTGPGAG
jgi:hypothetical protein